MMEVRGEKKEKRKVDTSKKETPLIDKKVDKELLQAFRFFARNQVGDIRVEDMRLIIHNLGNFLSHKDVKLLEDSWKNAWKRPGEWLRILNKQKGKPKKGRVMKISVPYQEVSALEAEWNAKFAEYEKRYAEEAVELKSAERK